MAQGHSRTAAIVAAAGRGERALGPHATPKQFRLLLGRPLFTWCLEPLRRGGCDEIVVVVPSGYEAQVEEEVGAISGVAVVTGGPLRQVSVARGLEAIDAPHIVVHDAARPLVDEDLVRRCIAGLEGADGAVAALPVGDTLKRVATEDIVETVPRAGLWSVQTPQAFRGEVLRTAHERAPADDGGATDDAALVERCGYRVIVVEGSTTNLKVTRPEDFVVVEALLRERVG